MITSDLPLTIKSRDYHGIMRWELDDLILLSDCSFAIMLARAGGVRNSPVAMCRSCENGYAI